MYFPRGFRTGLSIELGALIEQAYDQFDAFENGEDWELTDGYSLMRVLHYIWKPERPIEKGFLNFDFTIKRFSRSKREEATNIPIGFVAQRGKCLYVVLRGTRTVKEWVRNFSINLHPFALPNYGKVHEGFMQTFMSIRQDVRETLASANRMRIYVAGHSLGAALATLALPDIESTTRCKVDALYTYGSPRVGDDGFVRKFNERFIDRSFRIVNTSDVVTSIPLPVPLAGIVGGYFSHVDTPVDLTVQEGDLEENHSMGTYLSELKRSMRRKGLFS
jgi:triacylglycerol lipase